MKKRRLTKIIAVFLALTFFFSSIGLTTASAAQSGSEAIGSLIEGGIEKAPGKVLVSMIDSLFRVVLDFLSNLFGNGPGFVDEAEGAQKAVENVYEGTGKDFVGTNAADAKWSLGYANASLVPEDVTNGEYYIGGYIAIENGFTNVVEGVIDDMKVRTVALNDGSGRGTVLFATIDCIGITNNDIKDIRALLKDFAAENNIVAINVSSTHCHSCIDTEGLWTKNLVKIVGNGVGSATGQDTELQTGTNPVFMKFLKETVANAMKKAFNSMTEGSLTYATKDVGSNYFNNKNRPSATTLMTDITRFTFTPDNASIRPTIIVNMAAHPDVAGLPTSDNSGREISGDYVYYCGELLDRAGYNFMFLQGAICAIYMNRSVTNDGVDMEYRWMQSQRYGYEIARMVLSLTKTVNEIKADPLLNVADEISQYGSNVDDNGNPTYSVWYTGWIPTTESSISPLLNLYIKTVEIPVSNDLIQTAGKLNLANYSVIAHDDGSYSVFTEVGYMELGSTSGTCFRTVLLPGEVCQDLINGQADENSSLYAANSTSGTDFGYPTAVELFGEDVKCLGLMNDAVGYIVPDNDYTMGNPIDHYHELISLGQYAGSSVMMGLQDISNSIVRS